MTTPTYFTCTLGQAKSYKSEDTFTNITDLIAGNARQHGDLPAVGFCLPRAAGPWEYKIVTFTGIYRGSCNTAELISTTVPIRESQTVALLCPSTPEFLFTWLALMRLGHAVLFIAPQCSPRAIVELCEQCEVRHLFYDDLYEELVRTACGKPRSSEAQLQIHLLPFSGGIGPFDQAEKPAQEVTGVGRPRENDVAYLHHTSGTSSGIPKPIPQTHRAGAGVCARFDGTQHASFTTTPLYHGGVADVFRAWTSRALIWLFPGKDLPITAANIVRCLEAAAGADTAPVKYFSSVPYVLQMMASDDKGMRHLQKMDVVGVGGAALPTEVGDALVNEGVNLISRFGSAECGFLMSSYREFQKDREWQYLRPDCDFLRFEERDDCLSELVIIPGWPHMSKTNREDGSFATSDLFEPHSTISGAWRYHSRADSQLTLITGKKFDPTPLEDAIAAGSSDLRDVLIFGNGNPYPGALLFPSHQARDKAHEEILDAITAKVEKLNNEGESHTRISANMLFVLPYVEVPLEKSSKGTVLRSKAEERYASQIEAAYEDPSGATGNVSDEDIEEHIFDVVRSITTAPNGELEAETDLFAYGVDSVACIQIRHAVSKLLPAGSKQLPLTIVQDAGSVQRLSKIIIDLRHGGEIENLGNDDRVQLMRDLADLYSHISDDVEELPPSPPRSPSKRPRTVLLTGSTGSLGSHVLSQLIRSSEAEHIHVLLRAASQHAADERVRKALASRKLDVPSQSMSKYSVHVCSLSKPRLGLEDIPYQTLVRDVDVIYHLAWSVDFVMPLSMFKQHFAGLQSLLSLSLQHSRYASEPALLLFCSSTASASSYSAGESVPESIIEGPEAVGHIGYSQSKWVAENICANAVRAHPELRVSIVRVGQLSGDSVNGIWNATEAYPLLLSSLLPTGCLPDLPNESVSWIPVDMAASALLDLARSSIHSQPVRAVQVFHMLSQDSSTTWRMLLQWLRKEEDFAIVKPSEWLERLEGLVGESAGTHPSLKLLEFWKRSYGRETTAPGVEGVLRYDVKKSLQVMPALGELRPVSEAYARKLWLWIRDHV